MSTRILKGKSFWQIIIALWLVVSLMWMTAAPARATALQAESQADAGIQTAVTAGQLLQFTSGGQVLGFDRQGTYIVSPSHMLKTSFVGANPVDPLSEAAGTAEKAGAAAPMGKVTYTNLWDGVNLVYEAKAGLVVKSTYYIDGNKTEAALKSIRLSYNRPVKLDEQGNLVIAFEIGTLLEKAPVAWQEVDGAKRPVAAAYILESSTEISFRLGDFLPGIPVVIDPDTAWNTFLGGTNYDYGYAIVVDSSGNVYVTGFSWSTWGRPVRAHSVGEYGDAFAVKLDSSGVVQWNTFLGGTGDDWAYGIAVDSAGSVYIAGYSSVSWGSPLRSYTGNYDAFAVKLNSSGVLQWNTFLGGTNYDEGYAIAVDSGGSVYVTGYSTATWGSPIIAFSGSYDAFAAKLDSSGALLWNTFLGGTVYDVGYGIVVDSNGNVYVIGQSDATWGNPVREYSGGYYDAFAAKLNNSGVLQWNTFLGGTGSDYGKGISVDTSGNVYVSGFGWSTWGSPVREYAGNLDVFAAKLNRNGVLQWNTFLGGTGGDESFGISVDTSGNVYVAGYSNATWGSPLRAYTDDDAFAAKLDSSGALQWNTFLGGSNQDCGNGIAVDSSANIYVTGTSSANWGSPVRKYAGNIDAFVAKLDSSGRLEYPSDISVTLQGTGRPDPAGYVVPLTVKFFAPGADVLTGTPLYTFIENTTRSGSLAVAQVSGVAPGTYDISAVTSHCLTNVKRGVVADAPSTAIDLGTLLEGNADDSNIINITDFGLLAASYGKSSDDIGYNAQADFDRNGIVNIADFGLLAANYGKSAPVEVP